MRGWSDYEVLSVPGGGGTATFTVANPGIEFSKLTIWAMSGVVLTMTFQPQINGVNFGPATALAGARAVDLVFTSGGAGSEDIVFPRALNKAHLNGAALPPTEMNLTVLVTNNDASAAVVTMYACALTAEG